MSARILVVEDEPTIRRALAYALRGEGFVVEEVEEGETALEVAEQPFDLVILDLMLPKLSGTEVLRRLRARSAVPIIVLTARDSELDRVLGLERGADDYVVKPFSMAELVSRVRAQLRGRELERAARGGAFRAVGGLRIDLSRHQVAVDGRTVRLTASEFKLLALLAETPEHPVSRREIMGRLWETSYVGGDHVCDVHVSNLRRKIERDPARPERLLTVRGIGYKLMAA